MLHVWVLRSVFHLLFTASPLQSKPSCYCNLASRLSFPPFIILWSIPNYIFPFSTMLTKPQSWALLISYQPALFTDSTWIQYHQHLSQPASYDLTSTSQAYLLATIPLISLSSVSVFRSLNNNAVQNCPILLGVGLWNQAQVVLIFASTHFCFSNSLDSNRSVSSFLSTSLLTCTVHHLSIIIVQTYLKALNL